MVELSPSPYTVAGHSIACDIRAVGKPGGVVCGAPCRRQLWRELLDSLADEASTLRHMLGLPETETWSQPIQDPEAPDLGENRNRVDP